MSGFAKQEYVVCFQSVVNAIMAEQSLLEGKFSVRVMPVPSSIREGCGFCLRLMPEELEQAVAFLTERGLTITEAYLPAGEPVSYKKIPLATLINGKENDEKP